MRALGMLLAAGAVLGAGARAEAAGCAAADFGKQAQALIAPYIDAKLFSGTVLVARDGKPVFEQGFGLADQEWNAPNAADTKFRIGSVTKQFTATAILQLAEQGKLSIDDPISKYYPDAPPAWAKITLKHLLTHSSGIPSYTGLPKFFDREARLPHTPEELIRLTRDKPLEFEPGSNYAYDNTGYILLGYVVEKASGQPYAAYVQDHIFTPLGMRNSGHDSAGRIIPKRAQGYEPGPGGWANAAFLDMSVPYAAGSLYSTVDDLLIWDQALYAGKPLAAASMRQMFTDYGHKYGFGWVIDSQFGHPRIWHNGGINGFSASFQRYPDDKLTVVALSNYAAAPIDRIAAQLAGLCLGAEAPAKAITLPAATLDRYAGIYQVSPVAMVTIARDSDHLTMTTGGPPQPLLAKAEGTFFSQTSDTTATFEASADGKALVLSLTANGAPAGRAPRIDAAEAQRAREALAKRVKDQQPAAGSEAALRRNIADLQRGQPDYSRMSESLAAATRQQLQGLQSLIGGLGELQTLTFKGVGPGGADIYEAAFAKGKLEWRIVMAADGKIETAGVRPL